MTRGPFVSILKKLSLAKVNKQIADLDKFLNFSTFTRIFKTRLLKGIDTIEFSRGHILFDEGDASNSIYFIIEGEYEISKTFTVVPTDHEQEIHYSKLKPSTEFTKKLMNVP